ncbi:MAG: hypothetical protein A2787_08780 [Omnitrophica WOR_2 bacterium RIFCSPHIGHO2_01_FULL_48_9]|nr:MAG: hypothetical protein A3D10_07295 [Omnitrophica WOR_2 bacterium RIFCSPHIGHO2_02_FULL_48_11]OGX30251.1 MAG: hypothetical protein A2787_08780 [Omnitrophica WOR_2 bacterium RIFCSPHIGHO2_01_FULL_48_9]
MINVNNFPRLFLFVLSAGVSFAVSWAAAYAFFQGTVLTETVLGWTAALLNVLASDCIQRISLKKENFQFFKIFLGGNFVKFLILIIFIVLVLAKSGINKISFILTFAVANFIFFLYYISNLNMIFFPKIPPTGK